MAAIPPVGISSNQYVPSDSSIPPKADGVAKKTLQDVNKDIKTANLQARCWTIGLVGAVMAAITVIGIPFTVFVFFVHHAEKQARQTPRQKIAEDIINKTQDASETAAQEKSEIGDGSESILFESTEKFAEIAQLTSELGSSFAKELAIANSERPGLKNTPPLKSVAGGEFESYAIDENDKVTKNRLNPTSDALAGKEDHLRTVYVRIPEEGSSDTRPFVMSMAAAHTAKQGEELNKIVRHLHAGQPNTPPQEPIRTAAHQLLTTPPLGIPGLDTKYLEGEHKNIAQLNDSLKESVPNQQTPRAIKTNSAMNVAADLLPSNQYNSAAYKSYLEWTVESFKNQNFGYNWNGLLNGTDTCKDALRQLFYYQIENNAIPSENSINASQIYRTLTILDTLQNSTTLSPTARVLLELALDRELHVASIINCKSGQDRTGHMRSLDSALTRLVDTKILDPEFNRVEYVTFLTNLDENMKNLNKIASDCQNPQEIQEKINNNPSLKAAFRLQNLYFQEMQRVALPITAESTGVGGLKYHMAADKDDLFSNPHILAFVPRFTKKKDGTIIHLINPGLPRTLTQKGLEIIQGLAQSRHT